MTVEGEKRTEFCFLVRMGLVMAKNVVKQLGNGPSNRRWRESMLGEGEHGGRLTEEVHHSQHDWCTGSADGEAVADTDGLGDNSVERGKPVAVYSDDEVRTR